METPEFQSHDAPGLVFFEAVMRPRPFLHIASESSDSALPLSHAACQSEAGMTRVGTSLRLWKRGPGSGASLLRGLGLFLHVQDRHGNCPRGAGEEGVQQGLTLRGTKGGAPRSFL